MKRKEIFVSVDVETAGPIPGKYSLLSIGACDAYAPSKTFACDIKPINQNFDPEALKVIGMSLETQNRIGHTPLEAMRRFETWVAGLLESDSVPVFVGFNAPFDWSFINFYFHTYLGQNPFGFAALDIKAYYMGATGSTWRETRSSQIAKHLGVQQSGDHQALHDAIYQAELFRRIRNIRT